MSRIPAARASAFINLMPVAAVGFGWALLDEGLTPAQAAGALAVAAGVLVSQFSVMGRPGVKPKAAV